MFPPNCDGGGDVGVGGDVGGDIGGDVGDRISAGVVINTAAGFRYVVLSIHVFTSYIRQNREYFEAPTSLHELQEDEEPLDGKTCSDQTTHHVVVDILSILSWDRVVRIVKERDLMGLRRLGGVDRVVSLQRSHFEENEAPDAIDSTQESQEHWETKNQTRSFFHFLLQAFNSWTIALLFISAGLLFAIEIIERGLEDGWHDGAAVLIAIFLLVSFSSVGNFHHERKRVKMFLKNRNKLEVRVERNGKSLNVAVCDVKVFDTVHLKQGDQVPADGLFIKGENLKLDEALFKSKLIDHDRNPFLFSGSHVVEGHGSMIVTSIRSDEYVVPSLHDPNEGTLLQSLLDKPYGFIEKFALSMSVLIAFIVLIRLLFKKHDDDYNELPEMKGHLAMKNLMEIFESLVLKPQGRVSILASALVTFVIGFQHGMPFVIGVFLSHSNQKLSNEANLGNLSSCCTMGLVTLLVIDASGDLLCEEIEVKEFWMGDKDVAGRTQDDTVVSDSVLVRGIGVWGHVSPKDDFLLSCINGDSNSNEKSQVVEYRRTSSSGKKGCEVLMRKIGDEEEEQSLLHLHWKGPPSTILEMCSHFYDTRGERHAIVNDQKRTFENVIKNMENNGLGPIAFAYGQTEVRELKRDGLSLLAIVGLKYPCKEDIKSLVEALREAGLVIKLVSEDELSRVKSIAWELGFFRSGSNDEEITEAENIRGISVESEMQRKLVEQITVMGNSLSKDKLLMVEKLKESGKVVAFYGGSRASDALTLKVADVGITQDGRCTEMAKAVSDISLKNRPDPSVIRIRERGKQQCVSLQKFFQLQLTAWISGLIIILVSTMHSGESPLSSIHMTWVNFILCLLGGLMMAMELNGNDDRRPSKRTRSLITKTIWINVAVQVCYQVILLLIIFEYFIILGKHASTKRDKDVWETFIFNTFTLCQLINLLNVINLAKKEVLMVVRQSYWFLAASVTVVFFQFIAVQFGKGLLSGKNLNVRQWTCCFLLAAFSSLFDWAIKWLIS